MADQMEDNTGGKSQIKLKVEAPPEDKNMISSEDSSDHMEKSTEPQNNSNVASKPKSTVFNNSSSFTLRSSILGQPKSSTGSGFVLRPSSLGTKVENSSQKTENSNNLTSKNPFVLTETRFNPFASNKNDKNNTDNKLSEKNSENKNGSNSDLDKNTNTANNSSQDTPKFMPLSTQDSSKQNASTSSVSSNPNFVFGQNLHERIVAEHESSSQSSSQNTSQESSHSTSNGTSELLFTSAVKNTVSQQKEVKTLSESAREYEESRANKRKYEEVAVVTGEEDERNVLQINCKLFAFDKASGNWQERGRGTLRLNDKEITTSEMDTFVQSRLVIRTAGSLRVVLNTKIWAEMTIDLASQKSLRLTAMDATGQIKVFLIMANPEEIKQLHRLLEIRVNNEIERHKNAPKEPDTKKPAVETSD